MRKVQKKIKQRHGLQLLVAMVRSRVKRRSHGSHFVTVLEDNLGDKKFGSFRLPQDNRVSEELKRLFSLSKHHTFEARRGSGFSLCNEGRLLC